MKRRLELQQLLEDILGSRNVYFQPPTGLQLKYPCIVYQLNPYQQIHANDNVYLLNDCYTITVIDEDPESEIVDSIAILQKCSMDRHFISDNLYHSVFTIYY